MTFPVRIQIRQCLGSVTTLSVIVVALVNSAAVATMISATATYTNADPSLNDTVTIIAEFDSTGITGEGAEVVQVTGLVFDFSKLTFLQAPMAIVPQSPPYVQGTFLARYTDGEFNTIVSQSGAGGFAQEASRVSPTQFNGLDEFIVMEFRNDAVGRLRELIEFSGTVGVYELDLSVTPYTLLVIPEPGTAALLAFGLCIGVAATRRRSANGLPH